MYRIRMIKVTVLMALAMVSADISADIWSVFRPKQPTLADPIELRFAQEAQDMKQSPEDVRRRYMTDEEYQAKAAARQQLLKESLPYNVREGLMTMEEYDRQKAALAKHKADQNSMSARFNQALTNLRYSAPATWLLGDPTEAAITKAEKQKWAEKMRLVTDDTYRKQQLAAAAAAYSDLLQDPTLGLTNTDRPLMLDPAYVPSNKLRYGKLEDLRDKIRFMQEVSRNDDKIQNIENNQRLAAQEAKRMAEEQAYLRRRELNKMQEQEAIAETRAPLYVGSEASESDLLTTDPTV